MNCIFCKSNSDNAKSVEHIIPESLGNKSHFLPKGTVCDKCNNYFSIKIESKVLNSGYFRSLRHRNEIVNKKNNLPKESALIVHPEGGEVEIASLRGNILEVIVPNTRIFGLINEQKVNKLYVQIHFFPKENDLLLSRFLGKVAFEAMAEKLMKVEDWNRELVEKEELDNFRQYIRYGKGELWPYHVRRVYNEDDLFIDLNDSIKPHPYQVLHEYDFLFIDDIHLYFVCIIMGVEYVINLADRTVEHYINWLKLNNGKSPLERDYQIKQNVFS